MTSVELRGEKHTQARLRPPASGLPKLQEGKVSLQFRLTITVDLFSFSLLLESRFRRNFPGVDPGILNLIPCTNGQYLLARICMADLI